MIILSYNCRGLASLLKKLALKELIKLHNPDVLFLQEILGQGEEVIDTLTRMFPGWVFHSLDAQGRSRGIASGYNSAKLKVLSSWGLANSLALEIYS